MTRFYELTLEFLFAQQGAILEEFAITSVVAIGILILTRAPRMSARTRHALLVVALVKFAIPVWVMSVVLRASGIHIPQMMQKVSEAAGASGTIWIEFGESTQGELSSIVWAVAATWVGGALFLVAVQLLAIARVRNIARRAVEVNGQKQALLDRVRSRMGCRVEVRLGLTSEVSTPCVVRHGGIVMLIPDGVDYEEQEMEAVFAHEIAHVKRRDTTLRTIAGLVVAMNWPNPLVWLTRSRMHLEAESSCDAEAIAVTASIDRYLDAIRKSILPGGRAEHAVAGMMGSGLTERLRRMPMVEEGSRMWRHGLTLGLCATIVIGVTLGAAIPREEKADAFVETDARAGAILSVASSQIGRYGIFVNVRSSRDGQLQVNVVVKDKDLGTIISAPRIITLPNIAAAIRSGTSTPDGSSVELKAEILVDDRGEGRLDLEWYEAGLIVERGTVLLRTESDPVGDYAMLREPIDLMLKDAELNDVLELFGKLTGFQVQVPVDLKARVTIDLRTVALEDALDEVLLGTGAAWYLDGRTIVVAKMR